MDAGQRLLFAFERLWRGTAQRRCWAHVNRDEALPEGLANLGDTVRVIDRDGTDLGLMIVAEAQKLRRSEPHSLEAGLHLCLIRTSLARATRVSVRPLGAP